MNPRTWTYPVGIAAAACILLTGCGAQITAAPVAPLPPSVNTPSRTEPSESSSSSRTPEAQEHFTWRIQQEADLFGDGRQEVIRLSMVDTAVTLEAAGTSLTFEEEYGYAASIKLETADLDGDGIRDILVFINAGGSGGEMNLHAVKVTEAGLTPLTLPDFGYHTNAVKLEAAYEEAFTLYVHSPQTGFHGRIPLDPLSGAREFYDPSGRLIDSTQKPASDGISYYRLVDFGGGVSGLEVLQRLWGCCHADVLTYYSAVLTWQDGRLVYYSQSLLPPDAPEKPGDGGPYTAAFSAPEEA